MTVVLSALNQLLYSFKSYHDTFTLRWGRTTEVNHMDCKVNVNSYQAQPHVSNLLVYSISLLISVPSFSCWNVNQHWHTIQTISCNDICTSYSTVLLRIQNSCIASLVMLRSECWASRPCHFSLILTVKFQVSVSLQSKCQIAKFR